MLSAWRDQHFQPQQSGQSGDTAARMSGVVMLTPEQVRQVAEHLALHLPTIVQAKTERGALVVPANQKRLYLDVTEVETVLRAALRKFEL
jgi:hypothetical protein